MEGEDAALISVREEGARPLGEEEEAQASKCSPRRLRCAALLGVTLVLAATTSVALLPHDGVVAPVHAPAAATKDIVELDFWNGVGSFMGDVGNKMGSIGRQVAKPLERAAEAALDKCVRMAPWGTIRTVCSVGDFAVPLVRKFVEDKDKAEEEKREQEAKRRKLEKEREQELERVRIVNRVLEYLDRAEERAEERANKLWNEIRRSEEKAAERRKREREVRQELLDEMDEGIRELSKQTNTEANETRRLVFGCAKDVIPAVAEFENLYRHHESTKIFDTMQVVQNTFLSVVQFGHAVPPGFFEEYEAYFDVNNLKDGFALCGNDPRQSLHGFLPSFLAARNRLFMTHIFWCNLLGEHDGKKCFLSEIVGTTQKFHNDMTSYHKVHNQFMLNETRQQILEMENRQVNFTAFFHDRKRRQELYQKVVKLKQELHEPLDDTTKAGAGMTSAAQANDVVLDSLGELVK